MQLIRWVLLPSLTSALVVLGLVRACRWISSVSPRLGLLVAAGLGVRVAAALGLFWISFLHLPILSSLQNGPGFWRMALDSQGYYRLAVYGAEQGLSTIPPGASSRTYVAALAVWMSLTGTSVFSGVVLNLCCYVGTCALLIAVLRGLPARWFERTAMVSVAALSASPMLLFVSTQVLKDSFFLLFAVLLSASVWLLAAPMAERASSAWKRMALGIPVFVVAMFVTAGVRGYYPAIAVVACGFLVVSLILRRRRHYRVVLLAAALSLVAGAGALRFGSEAGSAYFRVLTSVRTPADVMKTLSVARGAFIVAGGATNVADGGADTGGGFGAPRDNDSVADFAEAMSIGVATMFVPLTILQALSIVHVSGGGAMRALGDIDTVCFDIMMVATVVMTWRLRREVRGNAPYLVFSISLALMLTVLMAYIVTNVGTLVRLRLMLAVPFWTMTFAFARLPRFVGGDAIEQPNEASAADH
ncbi:MAG: hypothetical protein ABMA15_23820 [Vicinamibacterales bacterium]